MAAVWSAPGAGGEDPTQAVAWIVPLASGPVAGGRPGLRGGPLQRRQPGLCGQGRHLQGEGREDHVRGDRIRPFRRNTHGDRRVPAGDPRLGLHAGERDLRAGISHSVTLTLFTDTILGSILRLLSVIRFS